MHSVQWESKEGAKERGKEGERKRKKKKGSQTKEAVGIERKSDWGIGGGPRRRRGVRARFQHTQTSNIERFP